MGLPSVNYWFIPFLNLETWHEVAIYTRDNALQLNLIDQIINCVA